MASNPNYFDKQVSKAPGGSYANDLKKKYLDPYNIVGDPGDLMNLGGSGYDPAIQGAKDAQAQANALSTLQWQRQMQGLQGAQSYVGNLQSLYNSIYGPGGGQSAPGGQNPAGATPSQMAALSGPPPAGAPPPSAGGGSHSASSITKPVGKAVPYINAVLNPVTQADYAYRKVKGWV